MKAGDRRRLCATLRSSADPNAIAFEIGDVITIVCVDRAREECHATDAAHHHHLFSLQAIEQMTVPLPGAGGLQ